MTTIPKRAIFLAGASLLCTGQVSAQTSGRQPPAQPPARQDSNNGPNSSDVIGVDDIIVTAQFREQSLQDTPIAITAISGAMLEARNQTNLSQIANQAPSVTLKPQGPAFGPSLGANIRGVGQFDFNPALEPGVGIYVDDVYYATLTGSVFDLLDLDRVEILRGPQGTLAGKNSIGGAVKLYSQRPTGSNSGYIQVAYGGRQRIDLRASADFGLTETVSARLSAVSKKQDGYIKRLDFGCVYPAGGGATIVNNLGQNVPVNPAGGVPRTSLRNDCELAREGEVDYQAVRGQLRFQPSDAVDINIIGDYTIDSRVQAGAVLLERNFPNGGPASPILPTQFNPPYSFGAFGPLDINPFAGNLQYDSRFVCGRFCNFSTYNSLADTNPAAFASEGGVRQATVGDGRVRFEGWGVSGQAELNLSDAMKIVSITAYRAYDNRFSNDDDLTPLAHSNSDNDLSFWSFSQEMRLNGSLGNRIEYTFGGLYQKQKSVYRTSQDLRYAGLPLFIGNDPVKASTKAIFAHFQWKPIDALTLTIGSRYTDEFKSYEFSRRNAADGAVAIVGPLDGVIGVYDGPKSTRWDYRLNAQYEVTRDISAYAQVSTGFKGGGINPRPFFVQQVLPFGPETLTSYEIGVKSDLFDRLLRVNAAAYYSKYKNIQLTLGECATQAGAFFGTPCALPANAGDADIKGFEIESSLRPAPGLMIDGSISYIDFSYKRFNLGSGGPASPNGPQFGDYPPFTPKWKWSLGVQYAFDLGKSGSLTPRFDASYQSDLYGAATNRATNLIPAYTLANARLTWANREKDLEISAEVNNLFDKYYFLTIFDLTIPGAGVSSAQPGRPREWAVSVKKKF